MRWFIAAASLPQRTQYKLSRRDISSTSRYGTPAAISLITASCLRASDVAASVMGQSTRTANSVLRGFVTPPPIVERSIVMSVSVCLCVFVCPRSYLRNYTFDLHQIFCACYLYGRGSILLWRRSDMLCTSGLCTTSLCVFVCPRSYLRNYTLDLHQIFCACYLYGRGSILLWRRSDMLCTSGLWTTSYLRINQSCSTSPPS